MSRIGRIFLTGLIAALPLMLTIFVTAWLLSLLNQYFGPNSGFGRLLSSIGLGGGASELTSYLIGLGIIGAGIYGLGLVVHSRLGSWVAGLFDSIVRRDDFARPSGPSLAAINASIPTPMARGICPTPSTSMKSSRISRRRRRKAWRS